MSNILPFARGERTASKVAKDIRPGIYVELMDVTTASGDLMQFAYLLKELANLRIEIWFFSEKTLEQANETVTKRTNFSDLFPLEDLKFIPKSTLLHEIEQQNQKLMLVITEQPNMHEPDIAHQAYYSNGTSRKSGQLPLMEHLRIYANSIRRTNGQPEIAETLCPSTFR